MIVKSYISTQKIDAQNYLEESLNHLITYETDKFEASLSLLKKIVKNQLKLEVYRGVQDDNDLQNTFIKINTRDFVSIMLENDIDIDENFFNDQRFVKCGFSISEDRITIFHRR